METDKQSQGNQTKELERSLIDQIVEQTGVERSDADAFQITKSGVGYLLEHLLALEPKKVRADEKIVNGLIAAIDERLSAQVDEILHASEFQGLESAWRGLKLVVDRTDFRENIQVELINASKDDLASDFENATEITKSGLYKLIYSAEYGQFGGDPYGAIICNFEFGPNAADLQLLKYVAGVATMAHAPCIAAASPTFFGKDFRDFLALPNLKDIHDVLTGPERIKWDSFRNTPDARSVGLTLPRFLLRLPYQHEANPVRSFQYNESVSSNHEYYLWGNAAFAFATRLTESFAKYRWCPNIIGPISGGSVEDLPVHLFDSMGTTEAMIPTEALISDRREFELAEEGFIPLTFRKGSDNACFFSANSCQRPKTFGKDKEGKEAEANYKLGTQLPYTFIVGRMAHYIKVLQREQLGSVKERGDLEEELNKWIRQYVADYEAQPQVRARRPLRQAQITVSDVEADPGWYRVEIKVRPHFKYMGAYFTLSLVGRLDKAAASTTAA